jgi:hypothetical protein
MRFVASKRNVEHAVITSSSLPAALIFSVHPLRVEVVCCASYFPYPLSMLFSLLSVHAFFSAVWSTNALVGSGFALCSVTLYGLAVYSEASAMMVPFVLLLALTGGQVTTASKAPLLTLGISTLGFGALCFRAFVDAAKWKENSSALRLNPTDIALRLLYSVSVTMKNQVLPLGYDKFICSFHACSWLPCS